MSQTIDQAFVKQYEADVHTAYQRMGSTIRPFVRISTKRPGKDITFQKIGKGTASTKTRHGDVPLMNADHTNVTVTLADYYAGDYVDKLDELKTNIPERQITVEAGAYALGRQTDALIVAALDGGAINNTAINRSAITANDLTSLVARLGAKDVPIGDGNAFVAVTWLTWAKINTLTEFANSQWVGPEFPIKVMTPMRMFAGAVWFPTSALTITANVAKCYAFHRRAIGHGIGADVMSDITWQGTKAAWFVNNMMSQGAVLIDALGCERLTVTENA